MSAYSSVDVHGFSSGKDLARGCANESMCVPQSLQNVFPTYLLLRINAFPMVNVAVQAFFGFDGHWMMFGEPYLSATLAGRADGLSIAAFVMNVLMAACVAFVSGQGFSLLGAEELPSRMKCLLTHST